MSRPVRIQRLRTKGFRLQDQSPDGRPVMFVGRPTPFGNPFSIKAAIDAGYTRQCAVAAFVDWLAGNPWACPSGDTYDGQRQVLLAMLPNLCGKHLACWCPLDCPCHADVLLELANS